MKRPRTSQRLCSVWIVLVLSLWGCFKMSEEDQKRDTGAVSSAHPLATRAGIAMLKAGGNAFDAAVTVAAVLNVVEPMNSGIGGYGTILIYDAREKRARFLDSSGKIPAGVNSDVFRSPYPDYKANRRGIMAVSTPGNVNAWWALSSLYGKRKWKTLFAEAILLAERGFPVNTLLAAAIGRAFPDMNSYAKQSYGPNGSPLVEGETLVQKDLARTLRMIADEGSAVVYRGSLAQAIDRAVKRRGGFLSIEDLEADRAEWWDPISIDYRGYVVKTASPPSTAFPSLIRLGMMSRFDTASLGHNSIPFLHRFAEVSKHAYWCRLAYAGDPEINPPPLEKLLDSDYWEEAVRNLDMEHASVFHPPDVVIRQGENTTHFVVADGWGNIVSATQTLGNTFGCRTMVEGTGIWLNNSLSYCTFEPKGNPMDAHPGHRKLSGDCPTILFKNDRPWAALGTPGGHTIGQTVPQMVMNLVDFRMNIQEALTAPRISFVEPQDLYVEQGIPEDVQSALEKMGHHIRRGRVLGIAHGLMVDYDNEGFPIRFYAAADPRGIGLALTF